MLMTRERRPAIRTMRGWAIDVLQEAGAIRECEEHGWMQDRADPHARERAFDIARGDPPAGVSPDAAAAERVSERMCKQVSVSLPYRGDSHDDRHEDYS